MAMVMVAVVAPGNVMAAPGAQLGTLTAPLGEVVNMHVNETVPANEFVGATVTVELVDDPGFTADGLVALRVNPGTAAAFTVTVTEVVDLALPVAPVTTTV